MSARKSVVLSLIVWGVTAAQGRAEPISWASGPWQWIIWRPAQSGEQLSNLSGGIPSTPPATPSPPPPTPPAPAAPSASAATPELMSSPPAAPATGPADAFINLGTGPYPEGGFLTSGGAQPWYDSSAVQHVFGGTPTPQQQATFDAKVLQTVQDSFQQSGLSINLTADPRVQAAHTVSVVSNTSNTQYPNAIGIADVGSNGYTFVDKFGQAQSPDELATAVAHNVAHELMHSLGVPEQPATTGSFVDNETTSWSILTQSTLKFSPTATSLLSAQLSGNGSASLTPTGAAQMVGDVTLTPSPVPEPATVVLWFLGASVGCTLRARRRIR